jgi:uncharacterized membrane protein YbjE (DUF340 family)
MTMKSTILALAVALVASGCTHDPINAFLAMFLLIDFAFGLGFGWQDRSAGQIRNRNNAKGCKYDEYYCA